MRILCAVSIALILSGFSCLEAPMAFAAEPQDYEQVMKGLAAGPKGKESEHTRLWRIFDSYWQHLMVEYPEWATGVGYAGQNSRWTDMSIAAVERRKRELDLPLQALLSIDRTALDAADKLNYDIFKYRIELAIEGRQFPEELMPINQLEGAQESGANTIDQNPTSTVKDYEDILQRLRTFPTVIDQSIVLMEAGLKAGVTPPRITLRDVPQQIKSQIVTDPMASPLLIPFRQFPSSIPVAEQERLRKEAATIYSDKVSPAYQKLLTFFTDKYLPNTTENLALSNLPNGKAWYAYNIRKRTSTKLTAQEIHQIGLDEVKRLRKEMDTLIAETKFNGTFQEFSQHLRTDKKFFFNDATELLVAYRDIGKRIDPQLMRQFSKLPRLQYGIEPVPSFSEKSQPTAYYRPGTIKGGRAGVFYANTYNIQTRPKWEMEALTLHEAVPGHHLQISLAQEMDNVPEFRRHGDFTAFSEGWGLYSEGLGGELGLYKDPYSRYGQLTYDMWRSIRLVLDTGIHSMGWTRQQAIDFFKDNCSKSEHDITVEVDRYIVWPGQAVAYKIGQLTFKDLREKAKTELGAQYDVRAFHDKALSMGTLPLETLRAEMAKWMAERKAKATASSSGEI